MKKDDPAAPHLLNKDDFIEPYNAPDMVDMSLWPAKPPPVTRPVPSDPRFKTVDEEEAWWAGVTYGINTSLPQSDIEEPVDPLLTPERAVAVRHRMDGWTPERQRAFVEALAYHGQVRLAAYEVGMSPKSAYRLRRRPDAEGFRTGWDGAIRLAMTRLGDIAMTRVLEGESRPVFSRGVQVGERVIHDNRLLMFLLRVHGAQSLPGAADAGPVKDAQAIGLAMFGAGVAAIAGLRRDVPESGGTE